MAKNPVGWFEIYVDDMERAQKFYEEVFQVKLEILSDPNDSGIEMRAFPTNMETYGISGALVKMEGVAAGAGSTMVYFSCDDCGVEEARVAGAGGTVERPKMAIGEYGFMSMVIDSEGNVIGLHSMQ